MNKHCNEDFDAAVTFAELGIAAGTRATVDSFERELAEARRPLLGPPTWREWAIVAAVSLALWAAIFAIFWALARVLG